MGFQDSETDAQHAPKFKSCPKPKVYDQEYEPMLINLHLMHRHCDMPFARQDHVELKLATLRHWY